MPDLYIYQVGKRYHPDRSHWGENVQFNYRSGAYECVLFYPGLTDQELAQFKTGKARFALVVEQPAIFFLLRFGAMDWSEASYSWHLVPADQQQIPDPLGPTEAILLPCILVHGDTGIIKAIRAITLSAPFSAALVDAIRVQVVAPFDAATFDRILAKWHTRPVADLVQQAIVRCNAP